MMTATTHSLAHSHQQATHQQATHQQAAHQRHDDAHHQTSSTHSHAMSHQQAIRQHHDEARQQTYIGHTLTIDDIGANRKITQLAVGKERVDSSYVVKPVKTNGRITDLHQVKLPKGSVAIGQLDLGHKVIVEEPNEVIKYVERDVAVEEIVYRPKINTKVVVKEVPVYYDEVVEEDVPVENVVYQDYVTEEFVDKVIKIHKPVPTTVERKIPVTLTIPKIIPKPVEKVVEVPSGEIIHKQVKVVQEKINHKRRFKEKHVPIIVKHDIVPVVCHDPNVVREVEVTDHYPILTPVDIHIAKPVGINIRPDGAGQVTHRVVTVPAAHYNTLLKKLNPNLHEDLPLFMEDGVIPMLNQELAFLYPPVDAEIEGFNAFQPAFHGVKEGDYASGSSKHHSSRSSASAKHYATTGEVNTDIYSSSYGSTVLTNHNTHKTPVATVTHTGPKKKVCGVC